VRSTAARVRLWAWPAPSRLRASAKVGLRGTRDTLADPEHEEHEERLEWLGLEAAVLFDRQPSNPSR